MKTAISVPDETFRRVNERAGQLGMSRSEFFARAAERLLDALEDEGLSREIDGALQLCDLDDSEAAAVAAGYRLLGAQADDW
ncbi:MAG TPA: ribbon-helix-helix protein, CopG family [Candidatus Binatia bacterium]|nr:ribbon-helix-helix protein, CopG family [Candidatus Binatia bacterium]